MITTNTEDQNDKAQNNKETVPSMLKKLWQFIDKYKLWLIWLMIAFLGISIVLWMFWHFVYAYDGRVNHDGFSKDPNDWGAFGSYFGGVLSPFFYFLTFAGLLWTIYIQTQQIKHLQNESKRTDLYRLIKKLAERIDYNYKNSSGIDGFTLFDLETAQALNKKDSLHGESLAKLKKAYCDGTKEADVTNMIGVDLNRLLFYLKMYETINGEMYMLDHYQWEYLKLMQFLRDNKLMWRIDNLYENFQGVDCLMKD